MTITFEEHYIVYYKLGGKSNKFFYGCHPSETISGLSSEMTDSRRLPANGYLQIVLSVRWRHCCCMSRGVLDASTHR